MLIIILFLTHVDGLQNHSKEDDMNPCEFHDDSTHNERSFWQSNKVMMKLKLGYAAINFWAIARNH